MWRWMMSASRVLCRRMIEGMIVQQGFYNNFQGECVMQFKRTVMACSIAAALGAISGNAAASGFALIEQSASGLGNAYAGGAAGAEDASTIFFNPAGMSRLNGRQIALALHAIKPSAKFSGTVTGLAPLQIAGAGAGGDAGDLALIPNGYFTMEINPQTRFGIGVNVPFGLQTEYDGNWMGRFQAIKSKIETVNLNPSLSYQLNDSVAIGAGVSYQHIKGDLSSAVNYSAAGAAAGAAAAAAAAIAGGAPVGSAPYLAAVAAGQAAGLAAAGGANSEGVSTVTGSDTAWGYNLGILIKANSQTRIGLAYRSSVKYNLSGSVAFASVPIGLAANPLVSNGPVNLAIKMPDTVSASVFHQLNGKWDLMADLNWTGWSVFQQLNIVRPNDATLGGTPIQENWHDTWRVSVGANHHYNEQWTARAGLALDQTPVSGTYRTARIPDADRAWLSFGGQYRPSRESAVDFGYAHLFVNDSHIADKQAASGKGNLIGNYQNSVDILSAQYTHNF